MRRLAIAIAAVAVLAAPAAHAPVTIAPVGGGDSGLPAWPLALGAALALVFGFAVVTKQRRPAPAS
jgi:hypothetical protein